MKMDNFGGNTHMIEWLRSKDSWRPFLSRISNQLKEIVDTPEAHRRGMMQLSHKTVVNVEKCRVPSKNTRPLKKRRRLRIISDSESDEEKPHLIPESVRSNLKSDAEGIVILSDDIIKTETVIVTIDSGSERDLPVKNEKKLLRKRHFWELFGSDSEDETTSSVLRQKFEHHDGKVVLEAQLSCDESDIRESETIIGDNSEFVDPGGEIDSNANVIDAHTQSTQCVLTDEEPVLKIKVTTVFPEVTTEIENSVAASAAEEPDSSSLLRDASNVESLVTVLENSENKVGKPLDKNDIVSSSGLPASPLDNSSATSRTGQIRVRDCRSLGISDNWCFGVNVGESASNSPVISPSAETVSSENVSDASNNIGLPNQGKENCIRYAQNKLLSLPENCKGFIDETATRLEFLVSDFVLYKMEEKGLQRRSQECEEEQTKTAFSARIRSRFDIVKENAQNTKLLVNNMLPYIQNYFCNYKSLILVLSGIILKSLRNAEHVVLKNLNLEAVVTILSKFFGKRELIEDIKSAVNDTCHLTTSNAHEGAGNSSWHTISDSLKVQSFPSLEDTSTLSSQGSNASVVPSRRNMNISLQQINRNLQPIAESSNNSRTLIPGSRGQNQTLPKECSAQLPNKNMPLRLPQSHVMRTPLHSANQGTHPCSQIVQSRSQTSVESYPSQGNNTRERVENSSTENVKMPVNTVMSAQQSTGSTNGSCEKHTNSNMQLDASYVLSRLHRKLYPSKQQVYRSTAENSSFASAKLPPLMPLSNPNQQRNRPVAGHSGAYVIPSYQQQNHHHQQQAFNQQPNFIETQSHYTPSITQQKQATYPSQHIFQTQQGNPNQHSQFQLYHQSAIQQVPYQQGQGTYESTQSHKMYPELTNSQNILPQTTSRIPQQPESHLTLLTQSQDSQHQQMNAQYQVPYQQTQPSSQRSKNQHPSGNQHESNQLMQPQQSQFFYRTKFSSVPFELKKAPIQSHQTLYKPTPSQIAVRSVNQSRLPEQLTQIQATSAEVRVASTQPIVETVNHIRVAEAPPAYSSIVQVPEANVPSEQTHGVRFALPRPPPARPIVAPVHSVGAVQSLMLSNVWHAANAQAHSHVTQAPTDSFRVQVSPEPKLLRIQASTESHRAQAPAETYQGQAPCEASRVQASSEVNRAQVPTQSQRAQVVGVSNRTQVLAESRRALAESRGAQALAESRRGQALAESQRAQALAESHRVQAPAGAYRTPAPADGKRYQVLAPTEAYRAQAPGQLYRAESHRALAEALGAQTQAVSNRAVAVSQRIQAITESTRAQASGESHRTQVPAAAYRAPAAVQPHRAQNQVESHRAQVLASSQRTQAVTEGHRVQAPSESHRVEDRADSHCAPAQFRNIQDPRVQSHTPSTECYQNQCSTAQSRPSQSPAIQSRVAQCNATQSLVEQTYRAEGHPDQTRVQSLSDRINRTPSPQCIRARTSSVRDSPLSLQRHDPTSPCIRAQRSPVESFRLQSDPALVLPTKKLTAQVVPAVTQHEQSHFGTIQSLLNQSVQDNREQLIQPRSSLQTLLTIPSQNTPKLVDCERNTDLCDAICNYNVKQSERNLLSPRFSSEFLESASHRKILAQKCNSEAKQSHPRSVKDNKDGGSCNSLVNHFSETNFQSVPSSPISEITLTSLLNGTSVSSQSVDQACNSVQTADAQMSILASQQPSGTNINSVDSSVTPVQMLCSQQISQLAIEKSSKPDEFHSRESSFVSMSTGKKLQTHHKIVSHPHTEISNPSREFTSKSSEAQVQTFEQHSKLVKNPVTDTHKLISPNELAISNPQTKASGFVVPQAPVLDEVSEQKRMKDEKYWVSLNKANKEITEEINKVKLILKSCVDSVRNPKQMDVVSSDSQKVMNVYSGSNISGDGGNIFSGNGTREKKKKAQEFQLCGKQDKSLKENDLRLLEATVLQELVSNADDSIVQSVKIELRNIGEEMSYGCSGQYSDCCIISENIIDVKEDKKDLGLSELKKEEVAQEPVMEGSDFTVASGSNEVTLPVIQTISPSVGRARSTSLDSGYTTPSPHLQVDSLQHHDNFQVGCVGERQFLCANCQQEASVYCSSCKGTLYCSTECQTTHWYMEHSLKCDGVPESGVQTQTQTHGETASGPKV